PELFSQIRQAGIGDTQVAVWLQQDMLRRQAQMGDASLVQIVKGSQRLPKEAQHLRRAGGLAAALAEPVFQRSRLANRADQIRIGAMQAEIVQSQQIGMVQ